MTLEIWFIVVWALHFTSAQRWQVHKSCANSQPDKIRAAFSQAVEFARVSLDVLDKDGNNEKVKSGLEFTVGDTDGNIQTARAAWEGTAQYDMQESSDIDLTKQGRHTDIVLVCDDKHLTKKKDKPVRVYLNEFTGTTFKPLQEPEVFDCFDPEKTEDDAPNAITRVAESFDSQGYRDKIAANKAAGLPPPREREFYSPRVGKVSTIDLCAWWLKDTYTTQNRWVTITDETITTLLNPKGIEDIGNNIKPFDLLLWTMSATFSHELTHTRLGTFSDDVDDGVNGCYGWECILILRSPVNGDSLAAGSIILWLFRKGFYVNKDGQILTI